MCANNNLIISIGIVALNEELYLPQLLSDILNQTYEKKYIEILMIDSCSTDNTLIIFEDFKKNYMECYYNIQVLSNKKKKQASGWNIAISNYTGNALVRIDAHARLTSNFIETNVFYLNKGEKVVGGLRPVISLNDDKWSNTLLLTELSLFGSSVAEYRRIDEEKYVKSMFHACYTREVLDCVKGFNENLGRTEDNEFHYRIRKKGYKLYYNSKIISYQLVRSSLKKMIKQKFGNGYWIGLTTSVCKECLSLYHYIPFFFVLSLVIGIVLLYFNSYFLLLLASMYCIFDIINTIMLYKNKKANVTTLLSFFIFPILHIAYGFGTLIGFLCIPYWKKKNNICARGDLYE